jgi:hypothetical protein
MVPNPEYLVLGFAVVAFMLDVLDCTLNGVEKCKANTKAAIAMNQQTEELGRAAWEQNYLDNSPEAILARQQEQEQEQERRQFVRVRFGDEYDDNDDDSIFDEVGAGWDAVMRACVPQRHSLFTAEDEDITDEIRSLYARSFIFEWATELNDSFKPTLKWNDYFNPTYRINYGRSIAHLVEPRYESWRFDHIVLNNWTFDYSSDARTYDQEEERWTPPVEWTRLPKIAKGEPPECHATSPELVSMAATGVPWDEYAIVVGDDEDGNDDFTAMNDIPNATITIASHHLGAKHAAHLLVDAT